MFRATQIGITNQSVYFNQQHFLELSKIQRQLSSGLKFTKPSENPIDFARVQSITETLQGLRSDQSQINVVKSELNQSVSTLLEIQNVINRAKQISLDAFQQNDLDGSKNLANEVDGLILRLESLVATQVDGGFLFSGTSTESHPVNIEQVDGLPIPVVEYAGANQRRFVNIGGSVSISTRYPASEFLFDRSRDETLFFGNTGAKAGRGTDSGVGRSFLDVEHTLTTYSGSSGIAPGTDSVSGDTIIGQLGRHTLTINDTSGTGASGTISLNGGAEVSFTSSDTNLLITGPQGEQVYVDTTAIAAGFSGDIDIEAQGQLTIDGGKSYVPIDFSDNQVLTNQVTEHVTNIDSRDIHRAGRDHIEYSGTADLFTALYELKDDLLNQRNLGASERSEAFARRTADLDRISTLVLEAVGTQSVSLEGLNAIENRKGDHELQLEIQKSDIQSVDLAQAATDLQNRQTLIQANFASLSIVQNLSVLDFLG